MAVEWTGLGPELLLRLDRSAAETLGSQLQHELRDAIRNGRLREGERLPSSRVLAGELGVSRGLVLESYGQLEAEGYLSTRIGSATRVSARAVPPEPTAAPPPVATALRVDFRYGVPDLTGFPMRDWIWALGEAGRTAPTESVNYGDPRGSLELREILAAYLRRVRGAVTEADQLVVCSGFAQGVNLIFRALARSGVQRVAVEDPGDRDLDLTVRRAGLEAVPVPVDERGVDVEVLSASGARAVVLTPAHQCPTGVVLAPERRQALVAWAATHDAVIIEDEYDAEFRYDRQPVGSLQGLAPDRVASVGSVSKSLAPGMRLGWVACPARLGELIAEEKRDADRGSPALDQLALARLIASGGMTGTCDGCGRSTQRDGTHWSTPSPGTLPRCASAGSRPVSTRWRTCPAPRTRTRSSRGPRTLRRSLRHVRLPRQPGNRTRPAGARLRQPHRERHPHGVSAVADLLQ